MQDEKLRKALLWSLQRVMYAAIALAVVCFSLAAWASFSTRKADAQTFRDTPPIWVAPTGETVVAMVDSNGSLYVATRCCVFKVR